jgi:hypothetical protein
MLKSRPIQLSSAVTESQASIKKPRLAGIDTMKFYAILAVVIIHVPILPYAGALPYLPEYTAIIEMLCWWIAERETIVNLWKLAGGQQPPGTLPGNL